MGNLFKRSNGSMTDAEDDADQMAAFRRGEAGAPTPAASSRLGRAGAAVMRIDMDKAGPQAPGEAPGGFGRPAAPRPPDNPDPPAKPLGSAATVVGKLLQGMNHIGQNDTRRAEERQSWERAHPRGDRWPTPFSGSRAGTPRYDGEGYPPLIDPADDTPTRRWYREPTDKMNGR